jgi:hypothetical protein
MHLHLLIPGLIWPEAMASLPQPSPLPSLELLLARSRRRKPEAADAREWLFDAHDVTRPETAAQTGDLPAAPFALLGDGGAPGAACWISADPVHLRLQRDTLLLADASLLAITRAEADALVASLNSHFKRDGFVLDAPQPDRWYARLATTPALVTTPLSRAAGQSVDPQLPRGADAAAWHARMNEAQMLLHEHPVNEAREARGQMPVNSLWFWGAGTLPARDEESARPFSRVWATDPVARGLALWGGALTPEMPASAPVLLEAAPAEGVGLVVLEGLEAARAYGDFAAWEARLRELESAWLEPLVAALREQRIGMLSVHGLGGHGGRGDEKTFSLEAVRHDLKRFWRRPKPLSKLLG